MKLGCPREMIEHQSRVYTYTIDFDMMARRLARRAEDREVPGSSPARD